MRTVEDESTAVVLDFCGFRFTHTALISAQHQVELEDAKTGRTTQNVEADARKYLQAPSPAAALAFSDAVCKWGRGGRVWGNLVPRHGDDLGPRLHTWLLAASRTPSDEEAVTPHSDNFPDGVPKGLAVSFASKHLRMLQPSRFAVLDDVLSRGLGFALNPKGYALFLRLLREFAASLPDANSETPNIGKLEAGLFCLVRQHVRSEA